MRKRYNSQQKVGIDTTTQNKTTTQEQVNSTPQTTQTDITSSQEKQTEAYHPTEAKRHTHLTLQDTTSGEETDHYGREEEKNIYLNRSIDHDNEADRNETDIEIGTSQPTHTTVNTKSDTEIIYPNKHKGNKMRKSLRERNALHAINVRGKREINYKFNTNYSKTPATKPEKVTTSNTNNNIKTTTTNPQNEPQPQNNTSANTTTPNHIGKIETTANNDNNTPIETYNNTKSTKQQETNQINHLTTTTIMIDNIQTALNKQQIEHTLRDIFPDINLSIEHLKKVELS